MAIPLSTIRQDVIDYLNRRDLFASSPDSSQFNTSIIDSAINGAIREVTTLGNFRVTEDTKEEAVKVDVDTYDLPSDFQKMRYVVIKDTNGDVITELEYKPPREFDKYVTVSADNVTDLSFVLVTSNPILYTIEGSNIRIKSKPGNSTDILSQHYIKFLAELTGTQDNYFTNNYRMFCMWGGLKALLKHLQIKIDETIHAEVREEYNRWLRLLIASEGISKNTSFVARRREYARG